MNFNTVCLGDTNHLTGIFELLLFSSEFARLAGKTPVFAEIAPNFQKAIKQMQEGILSPGEFNSFCNKHGLNMWISRGTEEKTCFFMTTVISQDKLNLYGVDNRDQTFPLHFKILTNASDLVINTPIQFFFPRSWPDGYGILPGLLVNSLASYAAGNDIFTDIIKDKDTIKNVQQYINTPSEPIILAYGAGHFLSPAKGQERTDMIDGLIQMGRQPVTINIYYGEENYSTYMKRPDSRLGIEKKLPDVGLILATRPSEQGRVIFYNEGIGKSYLTSSSFKESTPFQSMPVENKL